MRAEECRDIFALLSQYLDQELPADICRQIDSHISGCAPCVEFVGSLRKTVSLCRSLGSEGVPGPLPERLRQELLAAYRKLLEARER